MQYRVDLSRLLTYNNGCIGLRYDSYASPGIIDKYHIGKKDILRENIDSLLFT